MVAIAPRLTKNSDCVMVRQVSRQEVTMLVVMSLLVDLISECKDIYSKMYLAPTFTYRILGLGPLNFLISFPAIDVKKDKNKCQKIQE